MESADGPQARNFFPGLDPDLGAHIEVYCSTCGSCGVDDCCSIFSCKAMWCRYGEDGRNQYQESVRKANDYAEIFQQLGLHHYDQLTPERARAMKPLIKGAMQRAWDATKTGAGGGES